VKKVLDSVTLDRHDPATLDNWARDWRTSHTSKLKKQWPESIPAINVFEMSGNLQLPGPARRDKSGHDDPRA
jgi:hypothetical protein